MAVSNLPSQKGDFQSLFRTSNSLAFAFKKLADQQLVACSMPVFIVQNSHPLHHDLLPFATEKSSQKLPIRVHVFVHPTCWLNAKPVANHENAHPK
jgi:hypothetical protein